MSTAAVETSDLADESVITRPVVRDVRLRSGRTMALITLRNGVDRPVTFGPAGLTLLERVLADLDDRARNGEIDAVGVTGEGTVFAAGADLAVFGQLSSAVEVAQFGALGHRVFAALADLSVPSFGFINGLALGGGLELALHADYRTVSRSAGSLGLPEVSLGLIPGWGGAYLLPHLIGIDHALDVVLWNPLRGNRTLAPQQAVDLGVADVAFDAVRYLEDSLNWADEVLAAGGSAANRPHRAESGDVWSAAIAAARTRLEARVGPVPQAPWAALELLAAAADGDRAAGFWREDDAIATLACGDQFAASAYAFDLTRRRHKRPTAAPDPSLAAPVTRIGVVGAGLMARQFALLFLRRLQIPIVITDLDQVRVDAAVDAVRSELRTLQGKGSLGADQVAQLQAMISGTVDLADFAGCNLVVEAVFEDLAVKRQVLAAVERAVGPETVLATNTSSLSLQAIGDALERPARLVGIHFFNPVAVMPLIEIVRTPVTDDVTAATAFALAGRLGKTPVATTDTPGFVVNRLLAIVFGEAVRAVEEGTPLAAVERAFTPLCLPMTPFQLIDMVGWKIVAHVQDTMVDAFPDRFVRSGSLHRMADLSDVLERDASGGISGWSPAARAQWTVGDTPVAADEILRRVQDRLAAEIKLMLDTGVVADARDIDLCMILGGRWPALNGGITPYLDRQHASERVLGDTFHHPPITGSPASRPVTAGAS